MRSLYSSRLYPGCSSNSYYIRPTVVYSVGYVVRSGATVGVRGSTWGSELTV